VRLGGADIDGALVMIPAILAMSADGRKRVIIRFGAESTNGDNSGHTQVFDLVCWCDWNIHVG
jgi:hypothetical protein